MGKTQWIAKNFQVAGLPTEWLTYRGSFKVDFRKYFLFSSCRKINKIYNKIDI